MQHPTSLDPLADYLKPTFGNIYEYKLERVDDFLLQEWTAELRQAVKYFFRHEAPPHLPEDAFGAPADGETLDEWIEQVIKDYQPREVAYFLRRAAVAASLSLEELVDRLVKKAVGVRRWDIGHWLDVHATESQLVQMANLSGYTSLMGLPNIDTLAYSLAHFLEPRDVLEVWNEVTGSEASDLTDEEWKLLEPLIPAGNLPERNTPRLERTRLAISGMLYRSAREVPWSHIPARYGNPTNLYQRHANYRRNAVFAEMLRSLEGVPEATRLVEWLREQVR